jgi:ribosomal protein S18 acetylase RimI-like enzyme
MADRRRPAIEVRPAASADLARLQDIEVRAGRRFATIADPAVAACADHPPLDLERLAAWQSAGRAWVAEVEGTVVGFVVIDVLDGSAHVEEVAVDPAHGRRGIGRALVDATVGYARRHRLRGMTLTTFRDVPWNAPWYRSQGFRTLAEDEIGPQLRARRREEAEAGLDPERRACMYRAV